MGYSGRALKACKGHAEALLLPRLENFNAEQTESVSAPGSVLCELLGKEQKP